MLVVSCLLVGFDVLEALGHFFLESLEFLQVGVLPLVELELSVTDLSIEGLEFVLFVVFDVDLHLIETV